MPSIRRTQYSTTSIALIAAAAFFVPTVSAGTVDVLGDPNRLGTGVSSLLPGEQTLKDACPFPPTCDVDTLFPRWRVIPYEETLAWAGDVAQGLVGAPVIPPVECPDVVCEVPPPTLPRLPSAPTIRAPVSPPPVPGIPTPPPVDLPIAPPPGTPCWFTGECDPAPAEQPEDVCVTIADDCSVSGRGLRSDPSGDDDGGSLDPCRETDWCEPDPCRSVDCGEMDHVLHLAADVLDDVDRPPMDCTSDVPACMAATCVDPCDAGALSLHDRAAWAGSILSDKLSVMEADPMVCIDFQGRPDLFVPVGGEVGQAFTTTILEGQRSGTIRATFSNQIPQSKQGTNFYVRGSSVGGTWNTRTELSGAQGCGIIIGRTAHGDNYDVLADFAGLDYTMESEVTASYSFTVTTGYESTFDVSIKGGASQKIAFGQSSTVSMGAGFKFTYHGTRHQVLITPGVI